MKPCPERTIWSSSFSAGSDPILQHTFPRPAAHYGGVIALFRPTRREALSVFALGAAGYPLLEVCWRGRTHASMALAGGLAFLWIFREHAARRPLWARCLRGALGVTGMELAFGLVLNRALRLGVWDYSRRRWNLLGQICPGYTALWCLLCAALSPVCCLLRLYFSRRRVYNRRY